MGCGISNDSLDEPNKPAQVTAAAGKMTYFAGLRSRGEPTQLVAKYGNVKMEVDLIDSETWGKIKSSKIPSMPFITKPDGSIMLETCDIMKHLAELGGKFVVDDKQAELCKMANEAPLQIADPLWNTPPEVQQALGVPPFETVFEMVVPVFQDLVTKLGDGPFFAGEKPGYAEAFIFHNIDNWFALCKDELSAKLGAEAMGKLEAFYTKFAALDGVKEYLAGRPTTWGIPGSKANPAA